MFTPVDRACTMAVVCAWPAVTSLVVLYQTSKYRNCIAEVFNRSGPTKGNEIIQHGMSYEPTVARSVSTSCLMALWLLLRCNSLYGFLALVSQVDSRIIQMCILTSVWALWQDYVI